ncbi:MAG TPA: hypothetical protein PLL32_01995 [Anaeromyxobacteraceae bacterium]|nr:hypothetical protein [Anaeromyxobacteraceae bacterium]
MNLHRFAITGFDPRSPLHWIVTAAFGFGGLYLMVTSIRWVTTPRARTMRFRNMAAAPLVDRLIFGVAVLAYLRVGATAVLIAIGSLWLGL